MITPGSRYGKLTIISQSDSDKRYWNYKCDCGSTGKRRGDVIKRAIKNGSNIDCGCSLKKIRIGDRFTRLVIIKKLDSILVSGKKRGFWKCKCDCGSYHNASSDLLNNGKTKSCGCYRDDYQKRGITHICYLWKVCPLCKKEKYHTSFGKDAGRKGYLKSLCYQCAYKSKDPIKTATTNLLRKRRIKKSVLQSIDKSEFDKIHNIKFELQEILNTPLHIDHIYPINHKKFSGLTTPANLQITTAEFNLSKRNKVESLDEKKLLKGSKIYKVVRIHRSVVDLSSKILQNLI